MKTTVKTPRVHTLVLCYFSGGPKNGKTEKLLQDPVTMETPNIIKATEAAAMMGLRGAYHHKPGTNHYIWRNL